MTDELLSARPICAFCQRQGGATLLEVGADGGHLWLCELHLLQGQAEFALACDNPHIGANPANLDNSATSLASFGEVGRKGGAR